MIRWKGVIFILAVAGLFIVLSLIFTDRWLEAKLEQSAGALVGAKVEIDRLDFSPFSSRLRWQRLQVTDPGNTMRNLIETGECDADLEFWPLFSGKVIIENFQISDLRTGTPHQTDGKLKETSESRKKSFIAKSLERLQKQTSEYTLDRIAAVKQQVSVDAILQKLSIRSPQKIDSLKAALEKRYAEWDRRLSGLTVEQDLQTIRASVKKIDPQKIKKLDQLIKALKEARKIEKSAKKLKAQWKEVSGSFDSDLKSLKADYRQVDNWIKEDIKAGMKLAHLPDFSAKNIALFLFGRPITEKVTAYLGYLAKVRYYAQKYRQLKPEKEEKPPRFRGQDIYFYNPNARPDFWLKKLSLSGQTPAGLNLSGELTDAVSDQRLIDRPTRLIVTGSDQKKQQMELAAELNYLKETPQEKIRFRYDNYPLREKTIVKSKNFTSRVRGGVADIRANFVSEGDRLSGSIAFAAKNLKVENITPQTKTSDLSVYTILDKVLSETRRFHVTAAITAREKKVRLKIQSDLDDLLVNKIKQTVGAKIEKQKRKIQAEIERRVSQKKEELAAWITGKEKELRAKAAGYDKQIRAELAKIEQKKKELQKKIDDQKKKLGKDAANKLKGLFK